MISLGRYLYMLNTPSHKMIHQAMVKLMLNQVNEAIFILDKLDKRLRNDEWLFLRARCHAKIGELIFALELMLKIRNHFDKRYHQYFFDLIQSLPNEENKVYFLERHPKKNIDKLIKEHLLSAYKNLNENEKVIALYEALIEDYPHQIELKFDYAQFLQRISSIEFLAKLKEFISQHPHFLKFYLLLIDHAISQNDLGLAHYQLMNAYRTFPMIIEVHIKLIEFSLHQHLSIQAALEMRYAMWIFQYSQRICRSMEQLKEKYPELRNPLFLTIHGPIRLPTEIFHGFSLLTNFTNQVYLVGGAVRQLLSGLPFGQRQDLDFVSNEEPGASSVFMMNPHNYRLYNAMFHYSSGSQVKIDCFISKYPNAELMKYDVINRDFTISSFYCDMTGHIYDPTGMGVYDYHFKILRTIKPASICFNEDPIRILRALKHMLEGYRPTDDLVFALRTWERPGSLNQEHLKAVTRKILMGSFRLAFIHNLLSLNLYSKLYLLEAKASLEECLSDLDTFVYQLPPPMTIAPDVTMFR